jgi:hypothetical protein
MPNGIGNNDAKDQLQDGICGRSGVVEGTCSVCVTGCRPGQAYIDYSMRLRMYA